MPQSTTRQALTRRIAPAAREEDLEMLEANLLLISRRWTAVVDEESAPLPTMQYAILRLVVFLGEVPLRDLSETLDLDASTVSRHVSALVSLGYLERAVNSGDKRQVLMQATSAGRMESDRVKIKLVSATRRFAEGLTPEEMRIVSLSSSLWRNALIGD